MAIPFGTVLVRELHCLTEDGRVVITAQHWRDPAAPADRPRSWLRLVRNGRPRDDQRFVGVDDGLELQEIWAYLTERYAPTGLSEDQMWAALRTLTGIEQAGCASKDCAGTMPTGSPICPECGRHAERVASGSLSGVRRGREFVLKPPRERPETP